MPEDRYYDDPKQTEEQDDAAEDMYEDEDYADDYEDAYEEDQADQGDDEAEPTEIDDLENLLNFLLEEIKTAPAVMLDSDKHKVSYQMCADIVENIRGCLPDAVRYSEEILKRRDRILKDADKQAKSKVAAADARAAAALSDARSRAETIVSDAENDAAGIVREAEERARKMIDQSEIVRLAHEEADRIVDEARAKANEQRLQANRYAEAILNGIREDLDESIEAVNKSLDRIAGAAPVNGSQRRN
ncbi:MAG: hypothetical protein IJJ23_05275 [Clostridia bacterium]|nr:hypothetical protein [Clostridia bacterium]